MKNLNLYTGVKATTQGLGKAMFYEVLSKMS